MKHKNFVKSRFTSESVERAIKYKLDLVGVQKVRWEDGDAEPARAYTSFCGKENESHGLGTGFLCIRESYQQLRGLSLVVIGCHT
jgi:hypothetical protein